MLLDVSIAALVLLPSAVGIGATFPLAVRVAASGVADAGRVSARVYSWNTVGSIVGSIGTAFILLPELGFRGTLLLGVMSNLAIAFVAVTAAGEKTKLALPTCCRCARTCFVTR